MAGKDRLLGELREKFDEAKELLGFSSSFEEIDKCSYIKDMVLECGFVSDEFARQMCNRMVGSYYSWVGQFQAWLTPGMGSVVNHNEVKNFDEADVAAIKGLVHKAMYFLRMDKVYGIKRDWKPMGKLVDEMIKEYGPFFDKVAELLEKTAKGWKADS